MENNIKSNSEMPLEVEVIKMKKTIGLWESVSIIIGTIIGSGIFVSPVGVLKYSEQVGVSFIIWVVCGIFSALGAIVYAELGVIFPHNGGEYIYILKSFGPLAAFVCLWITYISIGAVSVAANALIFSEYVLKPIVKDCPLPIISLSLIAILGIMFLAAVNCYNVRWATKVSIIFTICKVSALLLIIGIGFYHLYKGKTESFTELFTGEPISYSSLSLAFYQGFWAYAGWNYMNFLIGEMKNPSRDLPLAILISLTIVTLIYISANVAYLSVLESWSFLKINTGSLAVAVVFAEKTMGWFAPVMPIFVGASVFGSLNSEFLSISRLTHAAANEGHFPSILGMLSYERFTPVPAVILLATLSVVFIFSPNVFYLIELSGFAFCIIAAMATSCILYIRYKFPKAERKFKPPICIPIAFLMADLFICILTVYQSPQDALFSLVLMASAIPVFWLFIVWKTKPKSFQNYTELLTVMFQKLMLVVPENN